MSPRKGSWVPRAVAWARLEAERLSQRAAQATLVGLGAAAALMLGAIWTYPGGSWTDRGRFGHAFLDNYWCDLLRADALNGHPNPVASNLAGLAMLTFAGALFAYWFVVARAVAPGREAPWVLSLGWLGSAGVVLIALSPADRFPALHAAAVVGSIPLFLTAVPVAILGLWRRGHRLGWASLLACCSVALASLNVVQYARQVYYAAEYAPWLPGVQKAATLCFMAWLWLVSSAQAVAPPPAAAQRPLSRRPARL